MVASYLKPAGERQILNAAQRGFATKAGLLGERSIVIARQDPDTEAWRSLPAQTVVIELANQMERTPQSPEGVGTDVLGAMEHRGPFDVRPGDRFVLTFDGREMRAIVRTVNPPQYGITRATWGLSE